MNKLSLTKEDVFNYLFQNEIIGKGKYGIVSKLNDYTLIKMYYSQIINTYMYKNINLLNSEIELLKTIPSSFVNNEHRLLKLNKLNELGLIKGIVTYNEYLIGVLLPYYKNYLRLEDIDDLDVNERNIIFQRLQDNVITLMKNNIYPSDIRGENILVRRGDLDTVLIDLDDEMTRMETDEYISKHSYIPKECMDKVKYLKKRL